MELFEMSWKPVTKAEWIAALRSGGYRQHQGTVHNEDEQYPAYCCIGVIGALAGKTMDQVHTTDEAYDHVKLNFDMFQKVEGLCVYNHLITMNDDMGKTFPQIADWVEANVKEVEPCP